jgi:hypothetical protein
VIPPSFDELVQHSELVFRGRVVAMKSGWSGNGAKTRIATWVTFEVERALRGNVGETVTLEFLGGTVGEKRFEAIGWPSFEVGDRGVFFVENRNARMCPLMALRHGRYRIVTTADTKERVVRDDYTPLRETSEVALALIESMPMRRLPTDAALTVADFEARIVARSSNLPRIERVRP